MSRKNKASEPEQVSENAGSAVDLSAEEESNALEGIVGEVVPEEGASEPEQVPAKKEKAKVSLKDAKAAFGVANVLHNGLHIQKGEKVDLKKVTQELVDLNFVSLE